MYTPIKLEAIKLSGRKDLTEGCLIEVCICGHNNIYSTGKYIDENYVYLNGEIKKYSDIGQDYLHSVELDIKILGHIPHLEDLFRVNREKFDGYMEVSDFRLRQTRGGMPLWQEIPYNPSIPLLDQPNLEDIINLFK